MNKSVSMFSVLALLGCLAFSCDKEKNGDEDGSVLLVDRVYFHREYGGLSGNDSTLYLRFEYDGQNRVTKIVDEDDDATEFAYDGSGKITSIKSGDQVMPVRYNGNQVDLSNEDGSYVITLNNDGLPVTVVESYRSYDDSYDQNTWTLTYDNKGNIIRLKDDRIEFVGTDYEYATSTTTSYSYDDKKSPLASCNLPLWFWVANYEYYWEGAYYASAANNFTKVETTRDGEVVNTSNFTNSYNKQGYVRTAQSVRTGSYGGGGSKCSFLYKAK